VFKGAELLTISAFGGLEVQVSGLNNGFNVYRFGTEANLVWPESYRHSILCPPAVCP
jgi:hypothetical protein